MKLEASIVMKGAGPIVAKLHEVNELKPMRALLEDASKIAVDTARQNAPRGLTGALAGGFTADIAPLSARVHTIGGKYPVVMEGGRKPGSKMPPASVLEQWARAKGFTNTFVLARSIAKRGIKGRFFRRKARSAVRREMPRLLDRMASELERIWGRPVADA